MLPKAGWGRAPRRLVWNPTITSCMSVGVEGLFRSALGLVPPRVACAGCGKTSQLGVPWAREGSGRASPRRLKHLRWRCVENFRPSRLLRCADKQLWRRIEYYVEQARALNDMSTVKIVGIDHTSLHKGQSYITVVHDLDAKRLLFATEGSDHQTVVDFAADLKAHDGNPEAVLDRTVRSIVETRGECRQHPDSCIAQVFTCRIPRQISGTSCAPAVRVPGCQASSGDRSDALLA